MKKPTFLFLLAGAISMLTGCSSTNRLTMNAVEPAPVFIPSAIQRVGIVNRTIPSDETHKVLDKMDQILSLEGLQLDKLGAENAIQGLYDELRADDRFSEVILIESKPSDRKGLRVFPEPLNWEAVGLLCTENKLDVLFVLEYYDTDTRADYQLTTMTVPNNLGIKARVPAHNVSLNTTIKNGWRIYDAGNRLLLDEFHFYGELMFNGQGINPVRAIEAVIGRKDAVLQESSNQGRSYAFRIRPFNKRIARDYYVRGTENFKIGKRRAQTGDWDGAAALWKADVTHPKSKMAGRACFNMAISNEINGNLEGAMDWVAKSYSDYGDKNALRYLNTLKYRVAEKQELQDQLSR